MDTTERTKTFLTKKNLATQDIVNLILSYNFEVTWYSAIVNLNAFYSHFKADFGQGRKIDIAINSMNADFRQTAKIGKSYRISADLFYRSKSIWSGTFTRQPFWYLDLGFQKEIFQKNGVLRLSVTDVFNTWQFDANSDFAGQKLHSLYLWESRQFKCSFTWRFGNKNVKEARKRETGIEDEKKRAKPANE
jgi:hypothetical protein